jgi:nitroimidazol reductase NimA-like FMN-containing flavoprotein (pyridoxamine 5'-phosphate oxidase superfamily)
MSAAEVEGFLAEERTATCATLGPRGWPHLMPLWYVLRPGPLATTASGGADRTPDPGPAVRVWAWTYAASQKVRNLERDPRATLQVEAGESYEQLRGVMLECEVVVHRDIKIVSELGREIFKRYASARGGRPAQELGGQVAGVIAAQAPKRVGLEFAERRRATWDHRKLGGVY